MVNILTPLGRRNRIAAGRRRTADAELVPPGGTAFQLLDPRTTRWRLEARLELIAGLRPEATSSRARSMLRPDVRARRKPWSVVECGAKELAQLRIADEGGGARPQSDRPLVVGEFRVTGGEAGIPSGVPAVDRQTVLPHADVKVPLADAVRRQLVRERDLSIWMHVQDQSMQAVEQRPLLGGDRVDVLRTASSTRPLSPGE